MGKAEDRVTKGLFSVSRPHLRHRAWLYALLAVAVLAISFRLALNPVARHVSHRALDSMVGYRGNFDDVTVSLLRLRYRIEGLSIVRDPGRGHTETLHANVLEARLRWRDLWHLRLAGVLRVDQAKATYVIENRAQFHALILGAEAFADLPDLGGALESLFPFDITRLEVRRSEALVVDRTEKGVPDNSRELWLHDVEATAENVGSRSALLHGEPATLALEAKLQRSGDMSLFITMDPLAYKLDFEGEASVRHLEIEELYGFVVAQTQLRPQRGTLDLFTTFSCQNGYLSGDAKPILTNVELAPTKKNVGNELLAVAGNAALGLASKKKEVATIIPFGGRVDAPEAHVWPALLTLLSGPTARQSGKNFAALPAAGEAESAARPNDEAKAHHRRAGRPPLSNSPQGVFERGAITKIEAALTEHGFATTATGTLEGPTRRQLLAFQDQEGLPGTGFPDRETLSRLGFAADALYRSNRD